jgi:hypothetical protein
LHVREFIRKKEKRKKNSKQSPEKRGFELAFKLLFSTYPTPILEKSITKLQPELQVDHGTSWDPLMAQVCKVQDVHVDNGSVQQK